MKINKNIYRKVFYLIAVFCLVLLALACDKAGDKSESKEMIKEIASKQILLFSKPNQEIVAILSAKYNQDVIIIEEIVDQYLTSTDIVYRNIKKAQEIRRKKNEGEEIEDRVKTRTKQDIEIMLGALDKSTYIDLVGKISHQYSLDPSLVASILFDYRILDFVQEAAKSNFGNE